jgi:glycosyltransferase involved in cell wall biosynthesis
MKVGIVTTWAECGAGHVSLAYARSFQEAGLDIAIYARGQYLPRLRWRQDAKRPWPVEQDRCVAGLSQVDSRQFGSWLKRFKPDWLIFNEQRAWGPVIQALSAGVRCAAYIDYYRADTVPLFALYDLLICHTRRHWQAFSHDPRAMFIPWGVDLERFSPGPRQLANLQGDEPLVIVHSAGMAGPNDRKGTDIALQAFKRIEGSVRMIIHTQLPGDAWPKVWRDCIESDPRIEVLTGEIDPCELYRKGDLYLYPSRLEGIGLTLPEALATGLAAVTTDAPPMKEFIEPGMTGSLVIVRDQRARCDGYYWPESLVSPVDLSVVLQSYQLDPGLARRQGQQARRRMEEQRDWRRLGHQVVEALHATPRRPQSDVDLRWLKREARFQDRHHEPRLRDLVEEVLRAAVRQSLRRLNRTRR